MQLRLHPGRLLIASALAVGAAFTSGCHHQTQVSYRPPPPPPRAVTGVSSGRVAVADTTRNTTKPSAAVPQAMDGFDDVSGKPVFTEFGVASWYGPPYHNHPGADGTIFDQNALTAAHRTLPMGSTVRVTNVATGESIVVRVTDRGPFVPGRVLDLSMGAAKAIGIWRPGTAQVKIEAFEHANNDPAGRWCVQIGAFKSSNDALDMQAALMDRFKTAKVIEFKGPTGHWVRVNPAKPDLAHANEVARSVGITDPATLPYVVRLD